MTPTALFRPVIAAERRVMAAPRRALAIRPHELVASIELSEGEILDDLLYPASRRALDPRAARAADANGNGRPAA